MEYAIETLQIELFKCKQSLRTEEHYSVFPEYHGAPVDYQERIKQLETAINKLKPSESTFVMEMGLHAPKYPDRYCEECVLSNGPMCLDRSYCKFKETGKTWRKKLKGE